MYFLFLHENYGFFQFKTSRVVILLTFSDTSLLKTYRSIFLLLDWFSKVQFRSHHTYISIRFPVSESRYLPALSVSSSSITYYVYYVTDSVVYENEKLVYVVYNMATNKYFYWKEAIEQNCFSCGCQKHLQYVYNIGVSVCLRGKPLVW